MSFFGLSQPPKALATSWLSDPDRVRRLDDRVRTQFRVAHTMRGLDERPPPFTVDIFVGRIQRAVRHKQWFVATSVCALLGELLWVAHDLSDNKRAKGIYGIPAEYSKTADTKRNQYHWPLQALRNVCAHPALIVKLGKEPPAMGRLIQVMKSHAVGDGALAEYLEQDWAHIHQRALAAWAIRRIDFAGRHELGEAVKDERR